MNSRPTSAKLAASRRRFQTTKRSAASPIIDLRILVSAPMIDREQVLHVARLARLELSEEEVERMAIELSGILEHVDKISALDLEDVEPTTHVIALENVWRADEPTASLPRERALEQAPDPAEGAFRVPSPGAS